MNNLAWTVLTNLVGNSMAFADAKAFVLAYYVLPGDQAAAATLIDNAETDIETLAGDAPIDRDASWYQINGPYQDELPSNAGQPNPSYTGADVDKVLTVGATGLVFTTGGGGGGLAGVGAFDTTPNADGLSVTGSDVSLSAADATHPGGVAAADQDFGTFTRTIAGIVLNALGFAGLGRGITLNTGCYIGEFGGNTNLGYNGAAAGHLQISDGFGGNTLDLGRQGGKTTLDLSGGTDTTAIKLKSPDGTVYTVTIADGGTWSIV